MRRWLSRAILAVFGLVAGLLIVEVILQAGALGVRLFAGGEKQWRGGRVRVLCLGDSNTYGLWMDDRSLAYPGQFESEWNRRVSAPKIEVMNVGYPGTNSSRLLRDFPAMLDAFEPEVAVVLVGVNDHWTEPVEVETNRVGASTVARIRSYSRVYRFAYMVYRALTRPEIIVDYAPRQDLGKLRYGDREFEMGFERADGSVADFEAILRRNLIQLDGVAKRAGVRLVLLTYPPDQQIERIVNPIIRSVSAETGVLLVDLQEEFGRRCDLSHCPQFLFPDQHPRAEGYRVIADTLVRSLDGIL